MCVHEYKYVQERDARHPGTVVIGHYELPHVGAWN